MSHSPSDKNLPSAVREAIRVQMVNFGEIPDRTSPDDFPDGYVLTREEIVDAFVRIIEVDRAARSSTRESEVANYIHRLMHSCPTNPEVVKIACELNELLSKERA